ncbi:MAG TPA: hypothetical protein VLJ76_06795 [Gaiellaceae bacterium]|nr:hypothetical protein [Gaiellaceae bacterium]
MLLYFIPLFVIGGLLVLFGILTVLARFRGGRYLRPLMQWMMKVPLLNRGLKKMSEAALERSDPELASAVKKLERLGANKDPKRAQQVMSQLSAAERKAVMEATLGHAEAPQPMNRAQRRKLEQQRKRS